MNNVVEAASWLRGATAGDQPVDMLTPHPTLALDDGYELQDQMLDDRCRAGEIVVGAAVSAIGRTSTHEVPDDEPAYRWLTDGMHVDVDTALHRSTLLSPRVRPEIAFVIDCDLDDPATSADDVLAATAAVLPAPVVVDYRLRQPVVRPGDVIAICAATSRFALGNRSVDPDVVHLGASRCELERNGEVATIATGAELHAHPAEAVAWLVRWLAARDRGLESGMVALSGGLVGSVAVDAGDSIIARFDGAGDVRLRLD